jgi:Polyketide cyclase / dehydrase and lipid transport
VAIIRNSTLIRCAPEAAFDYLVDVRSELEWNPAVQTVEKLTDGPVQQGSRFMVKWKSAPQPVEVEVVDFDRPYGWVSHNGGPLEVTLTIRLERVPDGTLLRSAFDARPHGWFRVVFPLFLLRLRREESANMSYLRHALERRVGAQGDA